MVYKHQIYDSNAGINSPSWAACVHLIYTDQIWSTAQSGLILG